MPKGLAMQMFVEHHLLVTVADWTVLPFGHFFPKYLQQICQKWYRKLLNHKSNSQANLLKLRFRRSCRTPVSSGARSIKHYLWLNCKRNERRNLFGMNDELCPGTKSVFLPLRAINSCGIPLSMRRSSWFLRTEGRRTPVSRAAPSSSLAACARTSPNKQRGPPLFINCKVKKLYCY